MNLHHLDDRRRHARTLDLAAGAIDFDLTSAEAGELEAHLAACPPCARQVAALRTDASRLGRPLALLPSSRVDDAVYAEIARSTSRPQRLWLLAAAALLLFALLGAVAVGAYLLRSWQPLPTTVLPTPTTQVVVVNPAEASRPAASPAATASSSEPVASSIDPVVLLRVDIQSDTSAFRVPALTVYRDGTVLLPDRPAGGGRINRLTPAGLALLLGTADADFDVASAEIGVDPAHLGGVGAYGIELRRDGVMVRRSTAVPFDPAKRAEAELIIALAEHLAALESWLPATAWAIGESSFAPYVPTDFLVLISVEKDGGLGQPRRALDVADVDWPPEGRLQGFGEAQPDPGLGVGSTARCGRVTLAESIAVQRALAAAPLVQDTDSMWAVLDWAATGSHLTVRLTPLLPEEPRDDCNLVGLIWG